MRKLRTELFPVALSRNALAKSLGIHRRHVHAMVTEGLPVYQVPGGTSRKILVLDACEHIKNHWPKV